MMKTFFALAFFSLFPGAGAQVMVCSHFEAGSNNVSEGIFLMHSSGLEYGFNQYVLAAHLEFGMISTSGNVLTGLHVHGSRSFPVKGFPVDVKGHYILNRFSDLMRETNWGLAVNTKKWDHFFLELGTNFKTYALNGNAREIYDTEPADSRLHENFNLIYTFSGYLKPHNHQWNIGLSCTNTDEYMINQSTNPLFNLQIKYLIRPELTVFLDSWYKSAGIFNISANYFGYFFRTGIKWEI